jgi:MiaB-like tRNA modifying enzyme
MRIFIRNFGCPANLANGEVVAGCLAEAGHEFVDRVSSADLVIYNTCAVKGPTENRVISALRRIPTDRKTIVAGCLPLINLERLNEEVRFDGAVGPATGIGIVDVVRRVSAGERVVALGEALSSMPSLLLPRIRLNPVIGIVPVNHGCLGSCAYCCVTFAKGSLRSHSVEEVVGRLKRDLNEGVREFWITSQDTASYGKDKGTNLVNLLKAISTVEGDFKVRVGMMTPSSVMGILDELVEAFRDGHVFKFVHLPVQSGSDEVLERMRRFYTVNDFKSVVDAFKAKIPDITLSTDIICGFPCESEKAFEETLHLVGEVKPDVVNISKFFPRPRTLAAGMTADFVPLREIKRRSSEATRFSRKIALERNQRWIGWTGDILVDEAGRIPCSWIGRNFAYKPVVVKSPLRLLGKTLRAIVVKAFWTHLEADIVE